MPSRQAGQILGLVLVLLPGAFSWWDGRRFVAHLSDPALPERFLAHSKRQVFVLSCLGTILLLVNPFNRWAGFAVQYVLWMAGGFAARRAVYQERWGFFAYLSAQVRLTLALAGVWLAIALAPGILSAGPALWPVALVAAGLLLLWIAFGRFVLLKLVGARAWEVDASLQTVLSRAHVPPPLLCRFGFPGGRIVNAFALPSTARAAVLFSDTLLEFLSHEEQTAVFAHEVAHLEHYTPARVWRMAILQAALALAATLGIAWILTYPGLAGAPLSWIWGGAIVLGLGVRGARHAKHETESDLRALALCGDAESLIRALTKIHVLARLPRQWDEQMDHTATHPSLRRRIQAIRAAAQISGEALPQPVIVAAKKSGTFVILEAEAISWLTGVPAGVPNEPAALREKAATVQTDRYSDLVSLRLHGDWRGKLTLRSTGSDGKSRKAELAAGDTAALQAALSVVDLRLAAPVEGRKSWALLIPWIGVALVLLAVQTTAPVTLLVTGAIVTFRSGRGALAAAAAVAVAAAVIEFSKSDFRGFQWQHYGVICGLMLIAGAAVWAAVKSPPEWHARRGFGPTLPAAVLAVLAIISALPPFEIKAIAFPPSFFAGTLTAALGSAAACLAYSRLTARLAATVGVVAAIVALGGLLFIPGKAASSFRWRSGSLILLQQVELPGWIHTVRLGPSGEAYAVQLPASAGHRVRVGKFGGESSDFEAQEPQFLDDDHLLVAVNSDPGLSVRVVTRDGSPDGSWQVALPAGDSFTLGVTPGLRDWVAVGHRETPTSQWWASYGRVGQETVRTRTWPETEESVSYYPVGGKTVFEQRMHNTAIPQFLWSTGSTEGRVWTQESERPLATWNRSIYCLTPILSGGPLACYGDSFVGSYLWLFSSDGEPPSTPLKLGTEGHALGVSKTQIAVWYREGSIVIVDPTSGEGMRFLVPGPVGRRQFLTAVVPLSGRLVTLYSGAQGSTLSLYRIQ